MSANCVEDCIELLPSGHFRLRMQVANQKIRGTFKTLAEAVEMRDAARREIADGNVVPVDGASVLSLGPSFLKRREGNRNHATDKQRWKLHIETATFAPLPVSTVVRRDILDWLDEMKAKTTAYRWGKRTPTPLALQTRRHCLNLLRKFFVWAIDREHVIANPTTGVVVEREDGDEEEGFQDGWYLDVADQRDLLACWDEIDDVRWRMEKWMVAFAIATGLRQGEQWTLHLDDVHVDGPNPHVLVQYGSYVRKTNRFRTPKGKKGEKKTRIVPLWGPGLEAAKRWLEVLPVYAPRNPKGLMFPSERGAVRGKKAPRSWKAALGCMRKVPRLGRDVWWHLLRHTAASSMVAGWWGRRWSLDEVRAILGHSSVTVTERYAHLAGSVVLEIGAQAQAAWALHSHAVATALAKTQGFSNQNGVSPGLRSRVSSVRTGPGVPNQNAIDVATAVATAIGLVQRIAAGQAVTDRQWVDATTSLIDALPASIAVDADEESAS